MVVPEHVPAGPRALLMKVLVSIPEKRPTSTELGLEPWVSNCKITSSTDHLYSSSKVLRSFSTKPTSPAGSSQPELSSKNAKPKDMIFQRQQDRIRSSQQYQQRYSSATNIQPQTKKSNPKETESKSRPVSPSSAAYNSEAYKAYYTANSPESRSPKGNARQGFN